MLTSLQDEILATLRRKGEAMFVSDLRLHLSRAEAVEGSLAGLEKNGAIIVRDHLPPDVHLEGEDLRVAGLVEASEGGDGIAACIAAIEAAWSHWLASFLAEHRCA